MKALVLGGGGFIGNHLVEKLKERKFYVRAVDQHEPEFNESAADSFMLTNLRSLDGAKFAVNEKYDYVFQLAADMGGAGYINGGHNDASVMTNNSRINLNTLIAAREQGCEKIFFSSSACVYNEDNINKDHSYSEDCAYPANPENEYGWEKLFSERLYLSYNRMYGMSNKIARFHNTFGERGTYTGGKEKCLAALCRKIAITSDGGEIEVWGDGEQTRSFLHVSHCIEGVLKLMESDSFNGPVNIGSSYMISINKLISMISFIAKKNIRVRHIPGPIGTTYRNSNNTIIQQRLGWEPPVDLWDDLIKTYFWIENQVKKS